MPIDREALLRSLLASFHEEAAERISALDASLPAWQVTTPDRESIELVFREVHSLKGAAGAVGRSDIERVCHAWEALLVGLRTGKQTFRPEMAGLFLTTLLLLKRGLAGEELTAGDVKRVCNSLTQMQQDVAPMPADAPPEEQATTTEPSGPASEPLPTAEASLPPSPPPPVAERLPELTGDRTAAWRSQTLRVRAELCDQFAYHSEALRQARLQAQSLQSGMQGMLQGFDEIWQRRGRNAAIVDRLRKQLDAGESPSPQDLRNLLDWQEGSRDLLDQLHASADQMKRGGTVLSSELNVLSDELSRAVNDMLQMSCRSLLDELPALVEDLAQQTGKQALLKLPSTHLQVDKRILDALRTPLLHLLRNAIDHGIELPAVRRNLGKPETGQLEIDIYQDSASHFCLKLRDDGCGINADKVRRKAEEIGLLKAGDTSLDTQQIIGFIFESGLSTSAKLTNLSGRGMGLSIVREELEQLGGSVEVANLPQAGTEFTIRLPMSRSSFRVILVESGEHLFGVPATAVLRTVRLPLSAIGRIENKASVDINGTFLPVWSLAEVLELNMPETPSDYVVLMVIGEAPQYLALQVDTLLGDQEITLKPLGKQLKRVRNLLGATVLGDGTLVPVLHPQDLYRSALQSAGMAFVPRQTGTTVKRKARVLVADDSFTSRGLLRALLETDGYDVQTANDGLEAWNRLKQGEFDLLVSDIEMPRMDGFTLTGKVRADKTLNSLPVVLITALHSEEDRARGLEAGANAYLVKGGLEQDTVLAAVKRLL